MNLKLIRSAVVLLLMFTFLCSISCEVLAGSSSYDTVSSEDLYDQGSRFANARRYQEALPIFEELYKRDPTRRQVVRWLGYCYFRLERYQEGYDLYKILEQQVALGYNVRLKELYGNLAQLAENLKKYEESISYSERSIEIDQNNPIAYSDLGRVYAKLGQVEKSIEMYKRSQSIRLLVCACDGLSHVYYDNGRYEEALTEVQKCIPLEPQNISLWHMLGSIYLKMKQWDKAEEAYLRCLSMDPNYTQVYNLLAGIYNELREYKKALKYAGKAINKDHFDMYAYRQLKLAHAFMNNPALDREQFLKTVEKGEKLSLDAGTAFNARDFDKAQALYEQALAVVPYDVLSACMLQMIADARGDIPGKVKYVKLAMELNPYDVETYRILKIILPRYGRADELKNYADPKTLD